MIKKLQSLFAWEHVFNAGGNAYFENTKTGDRKAKWQGGGYSAIDCEWLSEASGNGIIETFKGVETINHADLHHMKTGRSIPPELDC